MPGDFFGYAVSLTADGQTALVGAPDRTVGAAYVFVKHGGKWSEQQEIDPRPALHRTPTDWRCRFLATARRPSSAPSSATQETASSTVRAPWQQVRARRPDHRIRWGLWRPIRRAARSRGSAPSRRSRRSTRTATRRRVRVRQSWHVVDRAARTSRSGRSRRGLRRRVLRGRRWARRRRRRALRERRPGRRVRSRSSVPSHRRSSATRRHRPSDQPVRPVRLDRRSRYPPARSAARAPTYVMARPSSSATRPGAGGPSPRSSPSRRPERRRPVRLPVALDDLGNVALIGAIERNGTGQRVRVRRQWHAHRAARAGRAGRGAGRPARLLDGRGRPGRRTLIRAPHARTTAPRRARRGRSRTHRAMDPRALARAFRTEWNGDGLLRRPFCVTDTLIATRQRP